MFRIGASRGAAAVPLTERLPWAYFAARGIVFLKFGGFQRTLRFRGGDAASMGEGDLDAAMARLHDALRRVRGQMSLHLEARRVRAAPYPGGELSDPDRRRQWPDPVSFLFDEERRDAYDRAGAHFETERYVTFVWRCSAAAAQRARSLFVTGRGGGGNGKEGERELHEFVQASDTVKGLLDGVMKECRWLDDGETFDFLHKAVSTGGHPVRPSHGKARIDYDVADCRVVGGAEPMLGGCPLRVISVRNAPDTVPAALAALDTVPFEHRCTLRWMGLEPGEGLRRIESQLRDWEMLGIAMVPMLISYLLRSDRQKTSEAANAMAEDAREALHAARRDELTIGYANLNVVLWDRDRIGLEGRIRTVTDILQRLGLTVTSYAVAPVDTWLGTLPGHIYADLRRPIRTSVNLAHFAPYSSVWSGDARNGHLGGAPLLIATTDGSTPFRINLHRGDLGHTLVLGPSGAGKTTLLNALCVGWRRYPRARVCIFTIKGGGEILTRMLGGVSYDVGAVGRDALGFQPLRHADDPDERIELLDWILGLLRDQGVAVDTGVREEVSGALDLIAGNPPRRRTLTHLSGYLGRPALKRAIQHYALDGGNYGRLLDDDEDRIALVDDDGELVGPQAVGAAQHEIADGLADILLDPAADTIVERHPRAAGHAQTDGRIRPRRRCRTPAVMAAAARLQIPPAAVAHECFTGREQTIEGLLVHRIAIALAHDRPVPVQAEGLQHGELLLGHPWHRADPVDIFDANVPEAAAAARHQPTPERREQGAGMQRTGRRRSEPAHRRYDAISGDHRSGDPELSRS